MVLLGILSVVMSVELIIITVQLRYVSRRLIYIKRYLECYMYGGEPLEQSDLHIGID